MSPRYVRQYTSVGICSWWEDDQGCDWYGNRIKGLCPRHYDTLRSRGYYANRNAPLDPDTPMTCTCRTPDPVMCRIVSRTLIVPDAWECRTCGRAVLELNTC